MRKMRRSKRAGTAKGCEGSLTTALSSSLVPLFSAARTMEEMMKKKATPAEYRKSCKRRSVNIFMLSYSKRDSCLAYCCMKAWRATGVSQGTHHTLPAGDAHPCVNGCGQEDDEQQREEKGRAADKLKEVEGRAADTDTDQLLQHKGHQGQELTRERGTWMLVT